MVDGAEEQCLTHRDADDLALSDAEFLWRGGFRRILPEVGTHTDGVPRAPRPLSASDLLLARYLARWPKHDAPFEISDRMLAEAEAIEKG